ncbi:Magnesium chelatase [Pleodorina starrii]|nr:Magnesium chelatase [Pleodorina starrii]
MYYILFDQFNSIKRVVAYGLYKKSVCKSYNTKAACVANPADACSWDLEEGGCHPSESLLDDPKVLRDLRGNLYCNGSLFDSAMRCALTARTAPRGGGGGGGGASCTSSAAGAECVYLSQAQLLEGKLSTATLPYFGLMNLVSSITADVNVSADVKADGGLCTARWLRQDDTLAWLKRRMATNPQYGFLQPDLIGACSGTEWFLKALATATTACTAAGGTRGNPYPQPARCEAVKGCIWDSDSDSCQFDDYEMLLRDILVDPNDPWERALTDALRYCYTAGASRAACEAAAAAVPPLNVDPTRMATLQFALTDPNWALEGASAPVRGGGSLSWLMAIGGAAAAALLGGGRSGWLGGGI